MIYTVTFNPALDYVMRIADLQAGTVNRSRAEEIYCGGKGINVSIILKHLSVDSVALGFQGGFTGEELVRGLQRQGITADFVSLGSGSTRINVKIKGRQETDLNSNGPAIGEADFEQLLAKLAVVSSDDILVLAGSIPASLSADAYQLIMARLQDTGVKFVVDAERDLLVKTLPYHPFLIKPNHHELGEVFGVACTDEKEIISCVKRIQQRGARNVLVSRAADGALFGGEDGCFYRIRSPRGTVRNSVGAGDSMVAGFLKGLTVSLPEALKYAAAAGSATAFADDLASRDEILGLLPEVTVELI